MKPTADSDDGYRRPSRLSSRVALFLLKLLAGLPLPVVRLLGKWLGLLLYRTATRRRRIASINWAMCFPSQSAAEQAQGVKQHFIEFAQAWLDRSWLWEGCEDTVKRRLKLVDQAGIVGQGGAAVLFAPHFVGMDAGWIALTVHGNRRFCGIYARQSDPDLDRWMAQGRQRFGNPHIVAKRDGFKPLVSALRAGEPLYVLPDMDFGRRDSIFVPFFGQTTATVPSLPRFAKLGRAQVVPVVSRLTPDGYEVTLLPPWADYPTDDVTSDTARMNAELESLVQVMPTQYYWVHKRFKTRPAGEPSPYENRRRP